MSHTEDGHKHGEHCGCGGHHEHEHKHKEQCGCGGHHHEHEHKHGEQCSCGGHHHGHNHHHEEVMTRELSGKGKVSVYIIENLGCANCAAKMEKKINELDYIEDAVITFATKQLRVIPKEEAAAQDLIAVFQEICASIEPEVRVVERVRKKKQTSATHEQGADNHEGHSHEHNHEHSHTHEKGAVREIGMGAILFILGNLTKEISPMISLGIFVIAYLTLGSKIVLTAAKNLKKGHVFDENFLMSIATIGAFLIQEYPEAVGVMLFYRIGEYFEHAAVEKSRKQIMDAVDMRPEVVNLVEGSDISVVDAEEVVPGDIVLVRPGDRIPLDGTIVEGSSRIDTSPVTGEPVPIAVQEGDTVISGCVNTSGLLKVRVDKPLEDSMVTRILNSVENAAASKPKIDRFITRFARIYTPFVVALSAATAIIPSLVTGDWNYWVYTALTFLVISCPCALVLSVPLAFFSGIGAGSKKGILFKGGAALEAMNDVKAIVMDKTGTITKGNFVVQEVIPVAAENKPAISEKNLLALCASAEAISTHPIANSIVSAAKEKRLLIKKPDMVEEIAGKGIKAKVGKMELLCGNRKLMKAFQIDLTCYNNQTQGTEVLIAINGAFAGYITIADTVKEDTIPAIASIKKLGIHTAMLTGDSEENAKNIGTTVGIEEIHARLLPEHKLEKLQSIRQSHGAVMFVGDGINDAPVLAGADVGAAMGSGADAAIEAADVVFMTSSMEAVPQALLIARKATVISRQNVIFALGVKALVMILGLFGIASMWMAVFADTGVAMLCVMNSVRILYQNK